MAGKVKEVLTVNNYVALLRGINVGGNKKVSMPVLKSMFESMGFGGVRTYINSGNVVFGAADGVSSSRAFVGGIEREIEKTFGFPVDVVVRSADDLERILTANPFAAEGEPSGLHLHVGFMRGVPAQPGIDKIAAFVNERDEFRIVGEEIYVVFRNGMRDSKLGNNLPKIGVPVTLRNWNTTARLAEMAQQ